MELKIQLTGNNAAFDDGADGRFECARILRELAEKLDEQAEQADSGNLHDTNGNRVGFWTFS